MSQASSHVNYIVTGAAMIHWHTLDGLKFWIPASWDAFGYQGRVWERNAYGVFVRVR